MLVKEVYAKGNWGKAERGGLRELKGAVGVA